MIMHMQAGVGVVNMNVAHTDFPLISMHVHLSAIL